MRNAGREALSSAPLAGPGSFDAKVTTAAQAARLESLARFGPPLGKVWQPIGDDKAEEPSAQTLVPNPWTILTLTPPPALDPKAEVAVDFPEKASDLPHGIAERMWVSDDPVTAAAWHGSILPETDADLWLAAGFAEYEKVVALENALKARSGGKLTATDRARIDVVMYGHRSGWLAAECSCSAAFSYCDI